MDNVISNPSVDLWDDFLSFKKNFTSTKRKRIKTAKPVFNYKRYNQLKQELNKI